MKALAFPRGVGVIRYTPYSHGELMGTNVSLGAFDNG
jgi:hypothetical protein